MKNFIIKFYKSSIKEQKGYAILFTLLLISAISALTSGLTNATYKQMILSSLARDSQIAFYQADTAQDCALYADLTPIPFSNGEPWNCGGIQLTVELTGEDYEIKPSITESSDPCFRISIDKETVGGIVSTTINAKGYNICNLDNPKTVERGIEIKYEYAV